MQYVAVKGEIRNTQMDRETGGFRGCAMPRRPAQRSRVSRCADAGPRPILYTSSQQAKRQGVCPRTILAEKTQRGITDVLLLPTPTPSQYADASRVPKRRKDVDVTSRLRKNRAFGPRVPGWCSMFFVASAQIAVLMELQICAC